MATIFRWRSPTGLFLAGLFSLATLALAACGDTVTRTPLPIPTLTPTAPAASQAQERAVGVMSSVSSFKVSGRITQGAQEVFVNADVVRPSDFVAQASILEAGEESKVEAVAKGGALFVKPDGTQEWYKFSGPGVVGFDLPNVVEMLEETLAGVQGLAFQGREAVGGVETYHFRGQAEMEPMEGLAGSFGKPPSKATVDIWVGQGDGRVYKLGVTGEGEEGPYSGVFTFSAYNEAQVAAPAASKSLEDLRNDFIKSALESSSVTGEAARDKMGDCIGLSLGLDFLFLVMTGESVESEVVAKAIQKCLNDLGLAPKLPLVDPSTALPQTPAELKALLERLPVETQTCLRLAVGDQAYVELRAGHRLPTLQELALALPCLR
ncbi:MAG: LppX_LprAFG lipoprotein [SAR202 cluster bacterium]|nr:LppX_LprAFG lipoprotein [SAR202 cluster bacterium]